MGRGWECDGWLGAGHRAEEGEEAQRRTGNIACGVRDARLHSEAAMRRGRWHKASTAPNLEQRGRCFANGYKRVLGEEEEERMSGTHGA